MNPQKQENLNEYRLYKLVTQINSESKELAPLPILTTYKLNQRSIIFYLMQTINWFYYLPAIAKVIVVIVVLLLGFAILQAALKLIASIISMALLAGLVYLGYNFFVAGNSSQIKE
ncbi:hypothetical protein Riv7116_2415 [Rivularia sp. PCC 7116]|uniref:hypothetical protein n=1 Tax=Rivularia sp. PCC 7116 TaxID=373994 RepID=UPI00029ECADF|nr:hypothetical protein [Rivularia sp. PCC 7116]AFY54930.1 hypothetical protein Riv7116_2415 [Rivularia sp. PCC 7116]